MQSTPWLPEHCALLCKLAAEGLTYSQIARRMPFKTTRNAVVGKAHRLGLANKKPSTTPRFFNPNAVRGAKIKKAAARRASAKAERKATAAPLAPLGPELRQARPGVCRYIAGDPQISALVCGREADGGAWCAAHRALVYSPRVASARGAI